MTKKIDDLRASLFAATEGRVACDAINALTKLAKKGSDEAKQALAAYSDTGAIEHMRTHACGCLVEFVSDAVAGMAAVFRRGLSDPTIQYWSIQGFVNSAGRNAYAELAKLVEDKTLPLDVRCQAVKCLAKASKCRFDRNLPSDPGHWQESDIRLTEITAWIQSGCPEGKEYPKPRRHTAMDDPKTNFEMTVSRFERKLARKRRLDQDLAAPTNWISLASPEIIQLITARWKLPAVYLDFLTRFSPIRVTIESRKYFNHFQLFGAAELIEAQDGYSFNPVEQRPIEDWPVNMVVIANHGGDPFVLDLSKSDGNDAPVKTAEHGIGVWKFKRVADSFHAFLESLAK